jgi:hypothetical protein
MFIRIFTLDKLNIFQFYYEKFQSSLIYLACHWFKNKIDLIFNLLVLKF